MVSLFCLFGLAVPDLCMLRVTLTTQSMCICKSLHTTAQGPHVFWGRKIRCTTKHTYMFWSTLFFGLFLRGAVVCIRFARACVFCCSVYWIYYSTCTHRSCRVLHAGWTDQGAKHASTAVWMKKKKKCTTRSTKIEYPTNVVTTKEKIVFYSIDIICGSIWSHPSWKGHAYTSKIYPPLLRLLGHSFM